MRRLLLVLALALVTFGASSPPPPSAPHLTVEWDFDARCLDILEFYNDAQRRWDPVSGPYEVANGKYQIPIVADQPFRMFRVVRQWGAPFIVRDNVWPY